MTRVCGVPRRKTTREKGQVAIAILVVVSMLTATIGVVYTVAATAIARIELQNALDAGATAGAAVIADGLNLIAVTNGLLLTLGLGGLLSGGATLKYAQSVQRLQNAVISATPKAALATALSIAMSQGAELAAPIPGRGRGWPSLMVKRAYFLPSIFGKTFPLWIEDKFKPTSCGRFGDRVVMLTGVTRVTFPVGSSKILTAKAFGAVAGGRVLGEAVFWPLPEPGYFPRLMADER